MSPSTDLPPTTNHPGPIFLYASQTGTAQDIAEKLVRQSALFPRLPDPRLFSTEAYNPANLPQEHTLVLVAATAGQGDPTDSMVAFWRCLMRRSLPPDCLSSLHFAVLGLGDSSYQKYNFVGKKAFRRLCQLGATPLLDLGLGDDQHDLGVDGVLATWLPRLWTALLSRYKVPLENCESLTLTRLQQWTTNPPNKYDVTTIDEGTQKGEEIVSYPSQVCVTQLKSNRRVTGKSHFQDTRLIILDRCDLPYQPGDVLHVQPQNSTLHVSQFFELINPNLSSNTLVSIAQREPNFPLPPDLPHAPALIPFSWLARHYFNMTAVPRKSFFELMALKSLHEMERERLEELSAPEGLDDLLDYCHRPRRTILEVMADFPVTSKQLELADWFDLIGPIKSRAFSLASSPLAHPGELHLLVAVVTYKTKLSVPRHGLCSNYLAQLSPEDPVSVWVQRGTLKFPSLLGKKTGPLIMVGPGTGVAPFRSYLQERRYLLEMEQDKKDQPSNTSTTTTNQDTQKPHFSPLSPQEEPSALLFFGCRFRDQDFYFADEWHQLEVASLGNFRLMTAFSRDRDGAYVQRRILDHAALVWRLLIGRDSCFLLAGSAQAMPDGVRDAIKRVALETGGLENEAAAERFVVGLEQARRYQTETWS